MGVILYFAYGSNMLAERLQARCATARKREVATVDGFDLSFGKKSQDGSGKATISTSGVEVSRVYGVLFEINDADMGNLDVFEGRGKGYDRDDAFKVTSLADATPLIATTYIASPESTELGLEPYDWYLRLVLAGAEQHHLPAEYVQAISETPYVLDSVFNRKTRREALALLQGRGLL